MKRLNSYEKILRINRIAYEVDSLYHTAALKLGLSDSVMYILYMLYDHGGRCPLNEIHGAGLCKQTVNSAVRKMERENLLYLEQYRGRVKMAILTESGLAFAEQTVARLFSKEESAFASWTDEEIDTFIALYQKYLDCFREEIAGL